MALTPFFGRVLDPFFNDPIFSDALSAPAFNWPAVPQTPTIHNLDSMVQLPVTEVKDEGKQYKVLITPPPGMNQNEIQVDLDQGVLRVRGERSAQETTPTTTRQSRRSFSRMFSVPEDFIDGSGIKAKWNAGKLELDLPKKAAAIEGRRQIAIEGVPSPSASTSQPGNAFPMSTEPVK